MHSLVGSGLFFNMLSELEIIMKLIKMAYKDHLTFFFSLHLGSALVDHSLCTNFLEKIYIWILSFCKGSLKLDDIGGSTKYKNYFQNVW